MGQRGSLPAQLPANVKRLKVSQGTVRSETGAKAPVSRPLVPPDLSDAERVKWDQAVADLEPIGLLASSDSEQLRLWCQAAVIRDRAWLEIAGSPSLLVESYRGGEAKHPLLQVWRDATAVMNQVGKPLGLSPEARLRMPRVEPVFDDDDLD